MQPEIESVAHGEALLGGAATRAEITLVVLRNSATIGMTIDGRELARARNNLGGRLEPASRP